MADVGFYTQANNTSPVDTAAQFGGIANAAQQNKLLQTQNKQSQMDLVKSQAAYLIDGLSALSNNPNVTAQDVYNFGDLAVRQGIISPEYWEAERSSIPPNATPQQIQQTLAGYNARASTLAERYAAQHGYNLGAAANPVEVRGATGALGTTTLGNLAQDVGIGNNLTDAPAPQPGVGTNAMLPNIAPPTQPATPASSAGAIWGPTPQQTEMWKASAAQFQADKEAAANWQANKLPLEKMIELFPKTQTGLGSDIPSNFAKVAQTFGIPWGEDQAQNITELEKYAAQLARNSGAAANSVEQLIAAQTANPNATMNSAAGADVSKVLLSLARMEQGKVLAAAAQGVSPEQYSDFAVGWGADMDPRAFGLDLMDAEKQAALVKGMNDAEYNRLYRSWEIAKSLGLLTGAGQ